MEFINWGLVKHPLNWVILFLMVFIAMIFAHLLFAYFTGKQDANQ